MSLTASTNSILIEEVVSETKEIAEELKPQFAEVLRALMKLETKGLFPFQSSGQIVLHFNDMGQLVRITPSPTVRL